LTASETLQNRDVLEESTGMYPRRVSEAVNHLGPPPKQNLVHIRSN